MNGNNRRAVRWEQITKVSKEPSVNLGWGNAFTIEWGESKESLLRLTSFINGVGTLYSTIKGEVDNHRRSNEEDDMETVSPTL